jgi:hypothetical protein
MTQTSSFSSDDRQYTRQDWRNRNQVKAESGTQWLTIPVIGKFGQRIDETVVGQSRMGFQALEDARSAVSRSTALQYIC